MKILDSLNYYLQGFGFDNMSDLMCSTFHTDKNWSSILFISSIGGGITCFFEQYIGLSLIAYLAFLFLLILEFFTGVKASIKMGDKIESRKFGRMIIKIGIYTIILGITHILKTEVSSGFDMYGWVYYIIFDMVVIQLIISLFENLSKLGFSESKGMVKILKSKLSKWFDLEDPKKKD
jgi:hypothetical protein